MISAVSCFGPGPESRIVPEASWSMRDSLQGVNWESVFPKTTELKKKNCCLLQCDCSFLASREALIWLIHLNLLPFPDGGISWKADFVFSWELPSSIPASLWTHSPLLLFVICKYDVAGANTALRVLQMSTNRKKKKKLFVAQVNICCRCCAPSTRDWGTGRVHRWNLMFILLLMSCNRIPLGYWGASTRQLGPPRGFCGAISAGISGCITGWLKGHQRLH